MSRARFFAERPLTWGLGALMAGAVAVDVVGRTDSAVDIVVLALLLIWFGESRFRAHRDSEQVAADANARWALAGLMHEGALWPVMGGWALDPSAVVEWIRRVSSLTAPCVVELGPGTSTLLLARAVAGVEIYAVEHDPAYAERIRRAATGPGTVVVVEAALEDTQAGPGWYDANAIGMLPARVDALLVDGPPNWDGKGRRSAARTIIEARMSAGGLILVDDTHRPDERSMVRSWVRSGLCRVLQDSGRYVFLEKC